MTVLVVLAGFAVIVAVAIAVALIDGRRSASWRDVAAERRETWESNQPTRDMYID